MMQEAGLTPELKVREHIDLAASYYPRPYTVDEVMALVRIEDLANRRYGNLSGGQKRQVQFAIAASGRPRLLFLDEPTVGLDIQARAAMWETIRRLVADGCAVVLTTHYLEEAEALATRVAVINKGRLIANGRVSDLRSIVTRRYVSCVTSLSADTARAWTDVDSAELIDGRLTITTARAEAVVRRLLENDIGLVELEVRRAGLSEAFSALTQESV
jgi:ABC-2 type transport system ATP-binding protein